MKAGKILIIGGYGHVGRIISLELADQFPHHVIAAGRSLQKAEKLSLESKGTILPLSLDIFNLKTSIEEVLNGVSQVIMCLDQPDTHFVEEIVRKGIDYIDVTASNSFLESMTTHDDLAKTFGSSVILSVGLAPGLTNLLAAHVNEELDEINHLDIFIMLGMGDEHGDAAIYWTLDNANTEFSVWEEGRQKIVRSFEDGKRTSLPSIGTRTAYRFNFPDQHSLPKTLGFRSVSSRLCFDLEIVTKIFAALKKIGALGILRRRKARNILAKGLKYIKVGSNQFAIKVEAAGKKNGKSVKLSSTALGADEARMTGMIATQVAHQLYSGDPPSGIFHIEKLFELDTLMKKLVENDMIEITHETL